MARAKAKPLPTKPTWLAKDAFEVPFKWTIVTSEAMWEAELKRLQLAPRSWLHGGYAACHWFERDCNDGSGRTEEMCIICIDGARQVADNYEVSTAAMLGHECVHLVQRCMQSIGEKDPSWEFEAYVFQFLFERLLAEYARQVYGVNPYAKQLKHPD